MSVSYGGDSITFADNSTISSGWTGFKNIIMNGDMTVSQRFGTSANTIPASVSSEYLVLDRWGHYTPANGGKFSIQQVSEFPSNTIFTNSLKCTVTTANSSLSGSDTYTIHQRVEAQRMAHLTGGLSSGIRALILSFWVKSSVAQTYGGTVRIGNANASYTFTYTINQANTWEYKTIAVPASAIGTITTGVAEGLSVMFPLAGTGSIHGGTAFSWQQANYHGPTGLSNSWIATLGNTFNITGVQIEAGTSATSFDYKPYNQQLSECQRFYEVTELYAAGYGTSSNGTGAHWNFKQSKRINPTITNGTVTKSGPFAGTIGAISTNTESFCLEFQTNTTGAGSARATFYASAEY